jgi:hypothetical protein
MADSREVAIALRCTSNSPAQDLSVQSVGKPGTPAQRQHAADAAPPSVQAAPGKRRPAPLRVLRAPAAAPAPLVVEDDSKPILGDIGLGLAASSLLRLPGLPA